MNFELMHLFWFYQMGMSSPVQALQETKKVWSANVIPNLKLILIFPVGFFFQNISVSDDQLKYNLFFPNLGGFGSKDPFGHLFHTVYIIQVTYAYVY